MNNVKETSFKAASLFGVATMLMGTAAGADTFNLRVGSGHPPALPYIAQLKDFLVPEIEKRVADETEHEVRFVEAYGGSVAKLPEVLEAVESGLLDIGAMSTGFEPSELFLVNYAFHVPFGIADPVESAAVARELYAEFPDLPASYEAKNQRVLAILSTSDYNIVSREPIETLSDMEGLKILAAGPNLPWLTGTGAVAAQGSLAEAYNSLQTGVIDGMFAIIQATESFKLYEVAPNDTLVNFGSMPTNSVTVNSDTWNRLPEDVRKIIAEVAGGYEIKVNEIHRDLDAEALTLMRDAGVDVDQASPELREAWASRLAGLPDAAAADGDSRGEDMRGLLNLYISKLEERGVVDAGTYVID